MKSVLITCLINEENELWMDLEQFTSPFRTSARFKMGCLHSVPFKSRVDRPGLTLTVQFDLSLMEKGKWVKQLLSRRDLERLACGGQDPAEKWEQHCFLGRPVSPGQASTEMWSPWDTGVCAFSCLREEGLEEGVGRVSWVSRMAASCQRILGAIGKSHHSVSLLSRTGRDLLFCMGYSQGTLQKL